ncbi:hypothetical protein H6G06_06465 [Anabaena sphaerica FACHB-251]|uniref:Uncharacterized protein n=1 Tax=Anabaena sphaerica FACHB-251 TaxID=2692883 RepID=A0A927A0A3_9NOST|nr:hypothetical protein [Anabaena sphaerica]MBD2293138.1 hypothetical protein [Anabaena sphaerica FACHB-251]
MLQTTDSKNTASFFNSSNEHLLLELNSHEASAISGGFSLANDTDRTQTFSTFGATVPSQRYVLQPGGSGNYGGDYVQYNSSRDAYVPIQQQVDPNGSYHFITQGNNTRLVGFNEFRG